MIIPLVDAALAIQHAQTGVVPVIAQAGTALFPLIALGVTSALGLLLKPKELLRVFKEKPWIPLLLLAIGCAVWFLIRWMFFTEAVVVSGGRSSASTITTSVAAGPRTDWAKVALAILADEAEAKAHPAAVPAPSAHPITSNGGVPAVVPVDTNTPPSASATFFRGNVERSGHIGGPAPHALSAAWSYYAQDETNAMYLSSPAVFGDAIYSASCYLDPPSSVGTVFCLDAVTGKERWLCTLKDTSKKIEFSGFFSSPAITGDGKYLVIGQGLHADFGCDLICIDAHTGVVRWTVPTPLHLEGSPCIENDVVVTGAGAVEVGENHKPAGDPATVGNPGFVLGVRISDGKELFRATVNDPESSPILKNGICYIGSGLNGNAVVALRTLSDDELNKQHLTRELWRRETPYPATGAITLAGDLVLAGCGKGDFVFAAKDPEGLVIALDKNTGAVRWQAKLPDAVLGAIAVKGDIAMVPVRSGEVVAISLSGQGKELWRTKINKTAPVLAGPAFADDRVYAVSNDGYLVALDAATGKECERVYLNAKGRPGEMGLCTSSPIIANGRLYVGTETGGLRCFNGTHP